MNPLQNLVDKLLENIHELVNASSQSYAEKKQLIIARADDDERTALMEFLSWFPDEESLDDSP